MRRKISTIALNVFLLALGVITVYPFVWMLCSSFKQNGEIMALEQHLLPQSFTLGNFSNMNAHFNFVRFFGNSILVTVVVCACGSAFLNWCKKENEKINEEVL